MCLTDTEIRNEFQEHWILRILFLLAVFGELTFFGEVIKPRYFSRYFKLELLDM